MESEKLVSADGLREWLKKIPLHDLSDGRGLCRIIFAEDFERAMASFPGDAIQNSALQGLYQLHRRHVFPLWLDHAVSVDADDFCSRGVAE